MAFWPNWIRQILIQIGFCTVFSKYVEVNRMYLQVMFADNLDLVFSLQRILWVVIFAKNCVLLVLVIMNKLRNVMSCKLGLLILLSKLNCVLNFQHSNITVLLVLSVHTYAVQSLSSIQYSTLVLFWALVTVACCLLSSLTFQTEEQNADFCCSWGMYISCILAPLLGSRNTSSAGSKFLQILM